MKRFILHYLAVVLIFFCPYSVMAQKMEPIWYATLTVDVGTVSGKTKRGCGGGIDACSATTLSDRAFTIEGQTYTITELVVSGPVGASGSEVGFFLSGTSETSDAELIKHELLVGSPYVPLTMNPSRDSSPEGRIEKHPISNPTKLRFYWAAIDQKLSWSDGDKVIVSLVPPHTHGPRPGIPELTAVTTGPNAPTETSLTFTMGCVSPGAAMVTNYTLRAENKADPTKVYWHYEPAPLELSNCALTPAITATMTGLPSNTSATTYKVKARARNLFARTSRWSNEVELTTTAASLQVNQEETGTDFAKADPPVAYHPPAQDPEPEPVLAEQDPPEEEAPPATQTQEPPPEEKEQRGVHSPTDATLRNLQLSIAQLDFRVAQWTYTVEVAHGVDSLTVTPTANAPSATIKLNGKAITSGQASNSIALKVGENRIAVEIIAADGKTDQVYVITVTRAAPTFAFAKSVADQVYTVEEAIVAYQLPEAAGGQGAVTYRLTGLPAGLSFDASTRTISGTPETTGAAEVSYTATDSTGATRTLTFSIAVSPPLQGLLDLFAAGKRTSYGIAHAFPTPFNAEVTIPFVLAKDGAVRLTVYNLMGQPVRVLADGWLSSGVHRMRWDGRTDGGAEASSGVYMVVMQAGATVQTAKLTLIR